MAVAVGVAVGVPATVGVGVGVAVAVAVGLAVGVGVGVTVAPGVGIGVEVGKVVALSERGSSLIFQCCSVAYIDTVLIVARRRRSWCQDTSSLFVLTTSNGGVISIVRAGTLNRESGFVV